MVNNNLSSFRPNTNKEKFSFSGSGPYTVQRINDISQATRAQSVTAETLTLSAGAAGTTGKVRVRYAPIMDSIGAKMGYYITSTNSDTSISITHAALAGDEVSFDEYLTDTEIYALLANGEYTVDYTAGIIYYKKGTADTAGTIDYKYTNQDVNITMGSVSIGDVTSNSENIATEATLTNGNQITKITGPVGITGKIGITGPVAITGGVDINNKVGITGPIEITGGVDVNNKIGITGPIAVTGGVDVNNKVGITGPIAITGTVESNLAKLTAKLNVTNLDGVITDTNGDSIDISDYSKKTIVVDVPVNTGAVTVNIQVSHNGTDWTTWNTTTYTATTDTDYHEMNAYYPYLRVQTATQTDATVSAFVYARGI